MKESGCFRKLSRRPSNGNRHIFYLTLGRRLYDRSPILEETI
jgi:hypothetical protein